MIEKAPRRSILESPRHPDRESLPVLYVRFRRLFVVAEQEIDRFNGNAFPRTQPPPLLRASSSPSSPFLFSMRSQYNVEFFVDDATISAIYSKIIIVCLWKLVFFSASCIHVFKYPALIQIVGKYVYNDTCVSTVCKQSINGDRCVPWTSLLFDRKNLYQSILLTRRLFEGKG